MRIAYCLPEISHPGGIGRITTQKANYLSSLGHIIYIITTDQNHLPAYFNLSPNVHHIDLEINFRDKKQTFLNKVISKYRKQKIYKKKLSKLLHKLKLDFVISTFTNEATFLYQINDGSKKILESHFNRDVLLILNKEYNLSFPQKIYNIYKTYHNIFLTKRYDAFVVLTKEDAILWGHKTNMHIIPNMNTFENNKKSALSNKVIISVGRLDKQKSFDKALLIWKEVQKKYPDWEYHIYGQGEDKNILDKIIQENDLSKNTFIHNPEKNIQKVYTNASILIMTSIFEGWGLVLTEAMNTGIPCVAYGCKCGPKDIIDNEINGFCIPENDMKRFQTSLESLIADENLRHKMGNAAYYKSQQYSCNNIMEQWITLFNQLYNENK